MNNVRIELNNKVELRSENKKEKVKRIIGIIVMSPIMLVVGLLFVLLSGDEMIKVRREKMW